MSVILFTIIVCTLAFIGFLIYRSKDEETVGVVNPRFSNEHDLQEQFKEAYLWACKTFGVRSNVYTTLDEDVRRYSGLGVPYFTYYHVSQYSGHYPNMPCTTSKIQTWHDEDQQRTFALEFISLVNSMRTRLDVEDFDEFDIQDLCSLLQEPIRNINSCVSKGQLKTLCKQLLVENVSLRNRLNK